MGGPTYNVSILSKYLYPEYETLLLAGNKLNSEESSEFIAQKYGIKPIYIKNMHRRLSIIDDFLAYKQIRKIIKEFKPDIVHTHAAKSGALGRLAAYHEKVPQIYHTFHGHVFHSYFNRLRSMFYIIVERFLARKSTNIIAISDTQRKELVDKYKICNREKTVVIPLGFDLIRFQKNVFENRKIFRNRFTIKDDEVAIGIIGRLTAIKNHQYFLDAFKHLMESTKKKIKGIIVGDGEDKEELMTYAESLGLGYTTIDETNHNKPLCFTSWQKNIEMVNAGLDIVVLTSLNEGTPVSLIEAQAAGNPVVSTNVGGVRDILIENNTGYVADKNNFIKFAEYLKKLVDDKSLREKMGRNGINFVNKRFTYPRLVADMTELYDQGLRNNAIN